MADPRAPTRADLAKFLPDQRTIRAFEKLFELVPDDIYSVVEEALIAAGSADARSQMAIDAFERIADAVETLSKSPIEDRHTFLSGDYIDLPINGPHVTKERRIQWNADDGTVDIGLYGGSVLQVGQETMYYAKNTGGALIDNGSAVMFTGTVGASGKLTFGLAVSDGTYPADYMMGIATQDIDNNAFGYVTQFGLVRGFNTTGSNKTIPETWNDGDLLYFDSVYPGELTKNQPSAPAFHVPIAVVINAGSGGSGSIFVRMKSGENLNTLNDVYVNGGGPSAGQLLIYDATQTRWENANLTAGSNVTITDGDASIEISVASAPPSGGAGGVLSGTYPNPGFAVDMATQSELDAHTGDTSNPHSVTASQVGLGNVENKTFATGVADATHAATSKSTPVDADELPLSDSAASYAIKKLTWANLKATAKTYFDTLYQPLSATLTSWASKTVPTGDVVGTTDTQTLSNKTLTAPAVTGKIDLQDGIVESTIRTTVSALSTWTALPNTHGFSGLIRLRDNTLGGSACFLLDPNGGIQQFGTNQIAGLSIRYNSGASYIVEISLSSGTVPRQIGWSIFGGT